MRFCSSADSRVEVAVSAAKNWPSDGSVLLTMAEVRRAALYT